MANKKKPDGVTKLLADAIGQLPEAATAFYVLATAGPEARADLLAKLHEIEATADEHYIKALRKTAGTFITPFDREDIFLIVEAADDFIDQLDHVGTLLVGFKMGALPAAIPEMTKELTGASEALAEAVGNLKKQAKLEKQLFKINENFGNFDASYRTLLIDTLGTDSTPNADAPRIVALAMGLERACSRLNDLTRALAVTAIKET